MKEESGDSQERSIGGLRFTHDNRKPPNRLAQAFAAVFIICLSALLLAGTAAAVLWILGVDL